MKKEGIWHCSDEHTWIEGPNYIISARLGQIIKSEKLMPEVVLTTEATSGVVEGTPFMNDRYQQRNPIIVLENSSTTSIEDLNRKHLL